MVRISVTVAFISVSAIRSPRQRVWPPPNGIQGCEGGLTSRKWWGLHESLTPVVTGVLPLGPPSQTIVRC
ncbi:hypothetical protein VM98_34070 [Streptomyces rubellomurinus subsp. indigoferus]|nr:hypothetical protein VM98_34070 [Streptomyces rubellomurinus subsp. indigoferus]